MWADVNAHAVSQQLLPRSSINIAGVTPYVPVIVCSSSCVLLHARSADGVSSAAAYGLLRDQLQHTSARKQHPWLLVDLMSSVSPGVRHSSLGRGFTG